MNISQNKKNIDYWRRSGDQNWKTAQYLFDGKRYDAALFFTHLAIEKLLKGLVKKQTRKSPPFIHDLPKLAHIAGLTVGQKELQQLQIISTFHIAGRYDTEKFDFYKKCTKSYTIKQLTQCKEVIVWLKKNYRER